MDLVQRKLTRVEWNNTEVPVNLDEKEILKLIMEGYKNVDYIYNKHTSLASFLKMKDIDENMEAYLYKEFLEQKVKKLCKKYTFSLEKITSNNKKVNKGEMIKINNAKSLIDVHFEKIFEFCLINVCEKILKSNEKNRKSDLLYYYYSLIFLMETKILYINRYIINFVSYIINKFEEKINIIDLIHETPKILENNEFLNYFKDYTLYEHQKKLFSFCSQNINVPKIITYIAPTGTGKTLSPIGLSSEYKVIFLCAARHVGLALAKSAISIGKKVAFAFGCNEVSDIRLHYFSAKSYVKHDQTGKDIKYKDGTKKVDNTVGDNVEIMITDIKSYLCAMNYMINCNKKNLNKLITYWDEPTILMDKIINIEEDENIKFIHDNWSKNKIQNIVLSSATLPPRHQIYPIIQDFKTKFKNAIDLEICSHDCNKSIPIINKSGYVEMPHYICNTINELNSCVDNCFQFRTLFRYFDIKEVVELLFYLRENIDLDEEYKMENCFPSIRDITMNNLKENYLNILKNIDSEIWEKIHGDILQKREKKYEGSILLTTNDAYTLVDGPSIYLADDVLKVSKFMLQNAKIPDKILIDIGHNIEFNKRLMEKIIVIEKKLEDSIGTESEKENKMADEKRTTPEQRKMKKDIDDLYVQIKTIEIPAIYVPNTDDHLQKWTSIKLRTNEMMPVIEESIVEKIMTLDIENTWKVLLLMGIGVMTNHSNIEYNEIMKDLADKQKLYLIIATSDYIYGTNYQFCHGFIGKDLEYITQEKTIQAMGRIGRNQVNKVYSIRLREESFIHKIFFKQDYSIEAKNMVSLFKTDENEMENYNNCASISSLFNEEVHYKNNNDYIEFTEEGYKFGNKIVEECFPGMEEHWEYYVSYALINS